MRSLNLEDAKQIDRHETLVRLMSGTIDNARSCMLCFNKRTELLLLF
jgi:hypothetical protein